MTTETKDPAPQAEQEKAPPGRRDMRKDMRVGRFYIMDSTIAHFGFPETAKLFAALEFFPQRVEHLFNRASFEFLGYSPKFDLLQEGDEIPLYEMLVEYKDPDSPEKAKDIKFMGIKRIDMEDRQKAMERTNQELQQKFQGLLPLIEVMSFEQEGKWLLDAELLKETLFGKPEPESVVQTDPDPTLQ